MAPAFLIMRQNLATVKSRTVQAILELIIIHFPAVDVAVESLASYLSVLAV
jgi:hypothetical protein